MYEDIPNGIKLRSSVRKYKPTEVPIDKILTILDAARIAPSWKNDQPVRYVVVNDPHILAQITSVRTVTLGNFWLKNAPCMIVGVADPSKSGVREKIPYYLVDFGVSMENLMIAASSLGLGTCWIGIFNEKRVKSILSIPNELRVVALTPLGYPDYPTVSTPDESYLKKLSRRVSPKDFSFLNEWKNSL